MSITLSTSPTPLKNSSAISSPASRDYKSFDDEFTFSKLPFVYRPKRGFKHASNWRVPLIDDYSQACEAGRNYAAHFAQYLKDNPDTCGSNSLGAIAKDIDFKTASSATGYWVGFFSHLERLILAQAQHMDVFGDVERIKKRYENKNAKRALEDVVRKRRN